LAARCVSQACSSDWAAASFVDEGNDPEIGPEKKKFRLLSKLGSLTDARDGEGESPIDNESDDEESSDSLMFPAPLFFELDALINRVTLDEKM
jgi:hypothetical protein